MKKNSIKLIHILFVFNCYFAYAAPPVSHIKSAAIEVTQGKQIYANGLMQSVVRVLVELREDVTWDKKFTLYEFETKIPLNDLGWNVSEQDNGFDHNIIESRHSIEEYNTSTRESAIRYVSTKNNNTNIKMCFEIETNKNGAKSIYSTCDTYGLDKGTAEIFAKRPYAYNASDFIFSPKQIAFKLKSNQKVEGSTTEYQEDIKGEIYGLRTATHIPRNVSFKLLNKEKVIVLTNEDANTQKIIADSRKSVVRKYNFKDKSITNSDKYLGYQEAYLYDITGNSPSTGLKSALFKFINFNMSSTRNYQVEYKPFLKAGDGNIVDILDVNYYRTTFMINQDRCWNDTNKKIYGCRTYKTDQTSTDTESKTYPVTTQLNDSVFYQFNLQDNFGNKYNLLWNPYPLSGSTYLLDIDKKK